VPLVDTLTRSGEGRLGAAPEDVERSGCAFLDMATLESDYNAARSWSNKISRTEPRYSAKGHHIFDITVRPRLLSVTESVALPPRPEAVNMSNIDKFSMREWLVPPILLPIFFTLLVAAVVLIRW
jgi:hypothetical protein